MRRSPRHLFIRPRRQVKRKGQVSLLRHPHRPTRMRQNRLLTNNRQGITPITRPHTSHITRSLRHLTLNITNHPRTSHPHNIKHSHNTSRLILNNPNLNIHTRQRHRSHRHRRHQGLSRRVLSIFNYLTSVERTHVPITHTPRTDHEHTSHSTIHTARTTSTTGS